MAQDITALLRDALKDNDVSKLLDTSPKLKRLIKQMYGEIQRLSGEEEDDGSIFPIKSGGETKLLRTCDIYFFEAQGRKAALRTKAQEISFYSGFEQIIGQLPEWFLRCHRGYIVNMKKVKSVQYTENTIVMSDGSTVPFSRTYKDDIRAALEKMQGGGGGK